MSKKWLEISCNIAFWIITGLVIVSHYSIFDVQIITFHGVERRVFQRNNYVLVELLMLIALACCVFYATFLTVLDLFIGRKIGKIIFKSLLFFIVGNLLYRFFLHYFFGFQQHSISLLLSSGIFIFYFSVSITYAFGKIWVKTESKNQRLEIEKKQAELSLLRSQLHPHFLFNVLNNLLSMVNQKDNPDLAIAFERLSGLLRYVVVETADEKIAIRKEIEFIKNFADLQALRFEKEELVFHLEVLGTNDGMLVEPAIFIPFIENAFKYGVEPEKISTIKVIFDLTQSSKIKFSCVNQIHETMQKLKGSGLGIASSRKRLALIYPNRHHLTIQESENFEVYLDIET